jgi:hypothetical protein
MDVNFWSYRAELALRQGDREEAEKFLSICIHAAERAHSARSRARGMALTTQLSVLQGAPPNSKSLDEFVELFDRIKATTGQDYNAESLIKGLTSAGREHQARAIAKDFMSKHRLELCIPSPFLTAVVDQLDHLSHTSSAPTSA